eukprot:gene63-42_t
MAAADSKDADENEETDEFDDIDKNLSMPPANKLVAKAVTAASEAFSFFIDFFWDNF